MRAQLQHDTMKSWVKLDCSPQYAQMVPKWPLAGQLASTDLATRRFLLIAWKAKLLGRLNPPQTATKHQWVLLPSLLYPQSNRPSTSKRLTSSGAPTQGGNANCEHILRRLRPIHPFSVGPNLG